MAAQTAQANAQGNLGTILLNTGAKAIDTFGQIHKEKKQLQKQLTPLLEDPQFSGMFGGLTKDQLGSMSLPELQGTVASIGLKSKLDEMGIKQMQMKQMQAQVASQKAEAERIAQMAENLKKTGWTASTEVGKEIQRYRGDIQAFEYELGLASDVEKQKMIAEARGTQDEEFTGKTFIDVEGVGVVPATEKAGALYYQNPKSGEVVKAKNYKLASEPSTFQQLRAPDIKDMEDSMYELSSGMRTTKTYLDAIEKAPQGLDLAAQSIIGAIKTLAGRGLDEDELAIAQAKALQQGLLGAYRKQVVGGGVMTEKDALRVLDYLGGEISPTTNPDSIKAAIERVMQEKVREYNKTYRQYERFAPDDLKDNMFKPLDDILGEGSSEKYGYGMGDESFKEAGQNAPSEDPLGLF